MDIVCLARTQTVAPTAQPSDDRLLPVSTGRRDAAILPKSEDKPTSRERSEYVEVDP